MNVCACGKPTRKTRCQACNDKASGRRYGKPRPCVGCGSDVLPYAGRKRCAPCNKAHQNALKAAWREKNKDAYAAIARRYRSSSEGKRRARDSRLRKTFGISLAQYEEMLAKQGGRCDVCRAEKPGGRGAWHVDHDHASGAVRGLLCVTCNTLLGHARDSERVLEAAIAYLRRHQLGIRVVSCA